MKNLLIALVIMAPLYLFMCQGQSKQLDALSERANSGELSELPAAENSEGAHALQPYNRSLNKAKGVEAMLNQGLEDRMRNADGPDGRK